MRIWQKSYVVSCNLLACVLFLTPITVHAKDTLKNAAQPQTQSLDIRNIEDSSIDVFDVLSRLPQAEIAFENGNYALALQHYRYVHLHDPNQTQAALGYADAALALGKTRLAAQVYGDFTNKNMRAQNGLLLANILDGRIDIPETHLRTYLKTTPSDARLWNMLGHILDKDGRSDEARRAYIQAEAAGQRPGLSANNIGQSYLKQGHIGEALNAFTRASGEAPASHLFDNNRRLTLLLRKDYTQALAQLSSDRASQLLKDAGIIAHRQGEKKLAVYFLEKSIALNPVYDPQAESYLTRLSQ
ncbi:MAG: tetratricopeptide repeat protein [Litorimonas sp.]